MTPTLLSEIQLGIYFPSKCQVPIDVTDEWASLVNIRPPDLY